LSTQDDQAAGNSEQDSLPVQDTSTDFRPLRIWPVLMLLVGMLGMRSLPFVVADDSIAIWMIAGYGPILCSILMLVWWLAASRATGRERIVGFVGLAVATAAIYLLLHPSMYGVAVLLLTIPMGTAAFGLGAIVCWKSLSVRRTIVIVLATVCGIGFSALIRSEGMWGNALLGLHWRWEISPEEKLLATKKEQPAAATADFVTPEVEQALMNPEWPAFRGADRTGRQRGTRISADWKTQPPELLWKIAVGPGWSSFTVAGKLLFTQEQRGVNEMVVCYDAETGAELWVQQSETRFDEAMGGPGPRATPTLADGNLYVLGANGLLFRLNPTNGDVVWEQDLREAADREPPMWGFSSSPWVVDGLVIVYAGGADDKGILAFDTETGDFRWGASSGNDSYSSPQLGSIAGEELLLMLTNTGLSLLDPQTGEERLNYEWEIEAYRALQPHLVGGDTILMPSGMGVGTRRVRFTKSEDKLSSEELWTTRNLKSDFNDLVVYQGHAYGFDGSIFTCIDLENGKRKWKRGRYGKGQVLLVEDSGMLLVSSERGELVLLDANPEKHLELAKMQALEGKTWNHPVLIGDLLYIRNSQEAACYRLPVESLSEDAQVSVVGN